MAVFLWDYKTSYISVPKVACTSLKHMFFEVENEREFQPFRANGQTWHIHDLYPTRPANGLPRDQIADHARFALVRDPIKRFLSSYSNRVIHHKELSVQKAGAALRDHDLPPDPDLATFIQNLNAYCAAVPSIQHHTLPMVHFLGRDPVWYTGLYPIEQIDSFVDAVSARVGRALSAPRLQIGGPKIDAGVLTAAQRNLLMRRYEADYAVFGGWL